MNDEHDRIGQIEADQIVDLAVVLVENAFNPLRSGWRVVDDRDVQLTRRVDGDDRGG